MKNDSLLLQRLCFLFGWSSPSRSSESPIISESMSSTLVSEIPSKRVKRTIFQISWGGVKCARNDSKLDLFEALSFQARSLGQSFFGLSEDFTLVLSAYSQLVP